MSDYSSIDGVHAVVGDGILQLVIDRPRTRGALDDAMGEAMIGHLVAAGQDESVRAILLRGGESFCSGSDLTAKNAPSGARPRAGSIQRRLPSTFHRLIPLLLETQVPVVCAVRGMAVGLGFQLALAADFCIASSTARFWEPFLTRGFTPDSGATWLLPRLVGLARSRELLLLGRELSGDEAAAWGLIHAAVDDAQVEDEALVLARRLAEGPTVALGLTKWLLSTTTAVDLETQLRNEAFSMEISSRAEDFKAGITAFREKRPPTFGGR